MDGAAVLEVADHGDAQVRQPALGLEDGVEVEHRLRRVLVGAVAGIDHGHVGDLGGIFGRSLEEVAHHDEVHVVRHHLDGILERLPLCGGGGGGVGEAYYAGAEAVCGRLEAEARAGGRLEEQGSHHLAVEDVAVRVCLEERGRVQEL